MEVIVSWNWNSSRGRKIIEEVLTERERYINMWQA